MIRIRKLTKRAKWHVKAQSKLRGSLRRPRLSIYRSSKNIYAQVIDDENGKTIASFSTKSIAKGTKVEKSHHLGKILAGSLIDRNVKIVVFDRGGYRYHGRVKALAEGAREGGLVF